MKAVRIFEFGAPEVLTLVETERPIPAPDEILIKVYASAVNPIDRKIRDGKIVPRLHVKIELPLTPGWDTAGVVEEVGRDVRNFKKGDAVYGIPNFPGQGSYAEYVAAKAGKFALKPGSISFNEAAAVPVSAVTAWDGVFNAGKLQAGQRILIHGAAGNVGRFAVQFARWKGAYVIGTASAGNADRLKQLGVDEIIDYQRQKFEDIVQHVDVVFDAAALGNDVHIRSIPLLTENGILVTTQGFPLTDEANRALAQRQAQGKVIYGEEKIQPWLTDIARLIDEHHVSVMIGKVYPLDQAADAHRESELKSITGKVVLKVRKEH